MSVHEPSDGIAEELERQLQLGFLAAAATARRALAARRQAIAEAQLQSQAAARSLQSRLEEERRLAAACLEPVFDEAWWEAADPQQIASAWQQAAGWREENDLGQQPSDFDRAAGRIEHEVRERAGLDIVALLALAELQQLEAQDDPAARMPLVSAEAQAVEVDRRARAADHSWAGREAAGRAADVRYDDRGRREQLRERLRAGGIPEDAVQARTLADIGQACRPAEASTARSATHLTHPA